MEKVLRKGYAKNMLGFSKKRFFITLSLSILIWLVSVFLQGIMFYKVRLNLFSASSCEITGFPIADCVYDNTKAGLIQLVNIFFWFWGVHLFWGWFDKRKS